MAFIKKKSIPNHVRRDMWKKGGFRERTAMNEACWVSATKGGDLIKFICKNPNYGRKGDSMKTYHSTYSIKRRNWVG